MTTNRLALNATGGSAKVLQPLQIFNGIIDDSELHLCCLRTLSGIATLQLSEGSGVELGILSPVANAHWLIGVIHVSHDPFIVEQVLQVTDVADQLQHQNFVQEHYAEFIFDKVDSPLSLDPVLTIAKLNNYFAAFFNIGESYSDSTSYLKSIPRQSYWNFLHNRPEVGHVEIYADLSLLSTTTDGEAAAWQYLTRRERIDLIRVIEVWHQQLSKVPTKVLLDKLERSTNQHRQQLGGTLGNWWKTYGFAEKRNDRWEFDVPKMLAHYKLSPLSPAAITEFKRRAEAFKERYRE